MPEEAIATASRVLEEIKLYNVENRSLPMVQETAKLSSSG
jgi:hypothetical protein